MFKIILILISLVTNAYSIDIEKLLNSMTIEEKCGQMTHLTFDTIQKNPKPMDPDENPINETKLIFAITQKHIGSFQNVPYDQAQKASTWQKIVTLVQDVGLKQTRLKIPLFYALDSIHGANYIRESVLFSQPLSMANTFSVDIAKRVGEITAMETRAVGIPWNFNPVLDVGRQPLWSRIFETYGEDPYLTGKLGEAYIHGSQGNDLKNRSKVTSCLKHFIGYSVPTNGRDRTPAVIAENVLRDVFLPPFELGVLAGSRTVMINSAEVNGIPGHANYHYITEILRGELKFDGLVISDWEDVNRLYFRDKLVESEEEAVRVSVMAGVDMSIVPFDFSFYEHCVNISKRNQKFVTRVNEANRRILKLKDELGLFENPYPFKEDLDKIGLKESQDFNLEGARESIVLAKNDGGLLPLDTGKKVLVTGATGELLRVLNGGWSYKWQGSDESNFRNFGFKKLTIYDALKRLSVNVDYSEGANFTHITNLEETLNKAKDSDIIILTIGEDSYCETPGNINNLMISNSQQVLADRLFELNKPVVLVYIGGRPRIITNIVERSNSVLLGFLPGERGSEALADIIFGEYNPNGRLAITYPSHPNGYTTYDYKPIEVGDVNLVYWLFPFGHGLSYTSFTYSNLRLSTKLLDYGQSLTVTVNVKNTGGMDGKETVLLFLNDEYGSVTRPVKQLKGFKKVFLRVSDDLDVNFQVEFMDLSFINIENKRVVETGSFNVYIENLKDSFNVIKGSEGIETTTELMTTSKNSASNLSSNLIALMALVIIFK